LFLLTVTWDKSYRKISKLQGPF